MRVCVGVRAYAYERDRARAREILGAKIAPLEDRRSVVRVGLLTLSNDAIMQLALGVADGPR